MDPNHFDALARRLATSGTSRRRLLGGLAGTVVGGLLSGVGGGRAGAAPGGNSACAHFCASVFPPGPQRGQCVSDAAHGQGLCYQCGPKGNGSQKLCGQTCIAADGCCTSADCASDQCLVCGADHTCVSSCDTIAGQVCGQLLLAGTGCCYPSGTANVCNATNFETVCCTTAVAGGGQEVGCNAGGTCA